MNKPITATEAMAKLKEAFPNEYVSIKVELAAHRENNGTRRTVVQFTCYAASVAHHHGKTLDSALTAILEKAIGFQGGDSTEEIDRLNIEAHATEIDAANTAPEVTVPPFTVEEIK